jgi:HK97 family phage prohead protease
MSRSSLFDSGASARLRLEGVIRSSQQARRLTATEAELVAKYCRWVRGKVRRRELDQVLAKCGQPPQRDPVFLQESVASPLYHLIAREIASGVGYSLLGVSEADAVEEAIKERMVGASTVTAGASAQLKRSTVHLSQISKFVGNGKRKIRGLANSGGLDRAGDIVEPQGGRWTLPVPLLWQHKHDQPIGWVREIQARSDGLWIDAELAEGVGKADEAWRMIELGLVDSYSIGFRVHKWDPLPEGGMRFTSWSLLEISVVTVPCDPGAKISRSSSGGRATKTSRPILGHPGSIRIMTSRGSTKAGGR